MGYLVGIFLDSQVRLKNPAVYDKVISIDFVDLSDSFEASNSTNSSNSGLLSKLDVSGLKISGLVCTYETYVFAKARLGELLDVPALSIQSAQLCTDKLLMRAAFAAYDHKLSPAFSEIDSAEAGLRFAKQHGFPVIIKPANLVKSLLVIRCDTPEQLRNSIEHALVHIEGLYEKYRVYGRKPKFIIEQFMEGDLYSVAAFVDNSGKSLMCPGITELTNASERGFDDNFLYRRAVPAQVDADLEERLFEVARRGIQALKLNSSPAHVELMHTKTNEIKIIEIGARIGGYRPRMYKLSYGLDLLQMEVALAVDRLLPLKSVAKDGYTAVYEIFPHSSGTFASLAPQATVDDLARKNSQTSQTSKASQAYSLTIKAKPGSPCGPAKDGYKAVANIILHDADYQVFLTKCSKVDTIEAVLT